MDHKVKLTVSKKKLISYINQRGHRLTEEEKLKLINDLARFIKVIQRIYSEPQAQIKYKEKKVNGVKVKNRIIDTDIEELGKVIDKSEKAISIKEAFGRLNKAVTNNKHGK